MILRMVSNTKRACWKASGELRHSKASPHSKHRFEIVQ